MKQDKRVTRVAKRVSANAIAFAELVLCLSKDAYSRPQLIELTGLSDSCLRSWIKYLHVRKLIYICEHRRTSQTGACLLIYTWNTNFEFSDAPKPKRKTQHEYDLRSAEHKRTRKLHGLAF